MKKRTIFILSLLVISLLIAIIFYEEIKNTLTGKIVTGEITGTTEVSIFVLPHPPNINMINPKNVTYLIRNNLYLNYSASYADNIWYNLDNTTNTSITGNSFFNASNGIHTLYLYANNSDGSMQKNVTFTVNSTKIIIIDYKFNSEYNENISENARIGNKKGGSTNILDYGYEEIQNISELKFHIPEHGKIRFDERVNLIDTIEASNKIINISKYVDISSNRIEINSSAFSGLNKSATLYLYNLTLNNPRILKDGSVCSSTICTYKNYSEGTLIFNVTSFSVYSAEEIPTTTPSSGKTSGGSGAIISKNSFSVNFENIDFNLKQGEVLTRYFTITNDDYNNLNFEIEISSNLKNLLIINEKNFALNPKESKTIEITAIAKENSIPDLYLGKLNIKTKNLEKEIFTLIEIESKKILLDLKATIHESHKKVKSCEKLLFEMQLFNLGDAKRKDILIEYIILNPANGKEITKSSESLAIETQNSFIRELYIPEDINNGKYLLYVKAIYNGEIASSTDSFEIDSCNILNDHKIYLTSIILLLIIIIILVLAKRIIKRSKKNKKGFKDYKRKIKEKI